MVFKLFSKLKMIAFEIQSTSELSTQQVRNVEIILKILQECPQVRSIEFETPKMGFDLSNQLLKGIKESQVKHLKINVQNMLFEYNVEEFVNLTSLYIVKTFN